MSIWRRGYPKGLARQNEKTVPFHKVRALELRNHVSGKGDKSSEAVCLQEMALMFTCLQNSDFKDSLCATEMKTYHKCFYDHLKQKEELKKQLDAGILTPNSPEAKRLNHRQLNILLKKYPQYNYQEPKT